jgi:hypothetical protein
MTGFTVDGGSQELFVQTTAPAFSPIIRFKMPGMMAFTFSVSAI